MWPATIAQEQRLSRYLIRSCACTQQSGKSDQTKREMKLGDSEDTNRVHEWFSNIKQKNAHTAASVKSFSFRNNT